MKPSVSFLSAFLLAVVWKTSSIGAADNWPDLPARNGAVDIPAQEWPQHPGSRRVRIRIAYPGGKLDGVNRQTGLMLTLHNWGGEDCVGTASPEALARQLNVVAVCVNYLQSGRKASIEDSEPYDCGYLQGLDALRALWFVEHGLRQRSVSFDGGRVYCTGGSGGGNVTQMAAKLAPRTFACVVDLCGMKKLSHDIAFNLPGGSGLNARWNRDPRSRNYLSVDDQEIRFVGHPAHLAERKRLGSGTKIIVVHGVDDRTCPFEDAVELTTNMQAAGLDVLPYFVTQKSIDGKVFTSTGHSLGNRTEIVLRVAGDFLKTDRPKLIRRTGKSDFELRHDVRYRTSNGTYVISYANGYPIGRFEPAKPPVNYSEHQDLGYYLDGTGKRHAIKSANDWNIRREHILSGMQLVMGRLPAVTSRPAVDVKYVDKVQVEKLWRRKITYQSDPFDRVPAYLFTPREVAEDVELPAILCLQQTTRSGKDEPAGLAGKPNMHYGLELARRGYIVLIPDYPTFGEHPYDFAANPEYVSGSMKAIWDNIRAVDVLQSLPYVDGERIGVIGHSLGGHNAMFTAAFEQRLKVIVSSCGFTRFHKDDVPSWTGSRYMPRIASTYQNDANRVPFDFTEIVATFAPRPFLAVAATGDSDFDVSGVRDVIKAARPVYELVGNSNHLQGHYPNSSHDFRPQARQAAYEFLDRHLSKHRTR